MHIKKKLLKNFFVQYILGFFTFLYIRAVKFTSSIQFENESIPKQFWNNDKPFIFSFLAQSINDDRIFMEKKTKC